uniref:Ig-like domain-containing protein n=1 Tax=Chelonoidis abingdonii TaxID=106734 RepID=A0A8C0J4M1_CHEAB
MESTGPGPPQVSKFKLCCRIAGWIPLAWSKQDGVHQNLSPAALSSSEGQNSSLTCSYSGTARNVQWYRQAPGESPTFLGILYKDEHATWGLNLRAELHTTEKHSYLNITKAQLQDAATYLCAVEAQ